MLWVGGGNTSNDLLNPTDMLSGEETGPRYPGMGRLISRAQVAKVVKKLLGCRVPGVDKIHPELLKALNVLGLTRLCNVAWISGALSLERQTGGSHSSASLARSTQGYWGEVSTR